MTVWVLFLLTVAGTGVTDSRVVQFPDRGACEVAREGLERLARTDPSLVFTNCIRAERPPRT